MSSLRELQAAFVGGMFDTAHPGARAFVRAGAMTPQARLAIYRNNIFHNYHQALRDVYPVVDRLVGEDFFRFAADHGAMALDRLAAVPPRQLPLLLLKLHPACRLFASRFPVHRIWRANQIDAAADQAIDLGAGGVRLLIRRRGYAIEVESAEAAEFALLAALWDGLPLQHALERACAAGAGFDFAAFLRRRVGEATVVGFAVSGP